ncbi:MAG: hypothetical protein ABIP17_05985 [Ilumatobacteraceae bacterium]
MEPGEFPVSHPRPLDPPHSSVESGGDIGASGTTQLVLPHADAKVPPEASTRAAVPTRGAETWYRTDQDRFKSVRRRANPWYRRLGRAVIGCTFLAAAAVGLYFGARVVQDFLDRDRLPTPGVEVAAIRSTSFEIRSTAPAPIIDGTLTLDTSSRAFEFVGRGGGAQAGVQMISRDGTTVLIRRGTGEFSAPGPADQVASDVQRAVSYLVNDDTADAILTNRLRRGYVNLDDRTEVGAGNDRVIRYETRIDTASFSRDLPLQAQEFRDGAIPGVADVRSLPVTLSVDADGVLVGVDDSITNWSWQRLAYSDQPFVPTGEDPGLDMPITITDGNIDAG